MRYISLLLLLSFLPQQNQLSQAEEEKGGLWEAPVLVRTWSKSPGFVDMGVGGREESQGSAVYSRQDAQGVKREARRWEEGHSKRRRGEKRWDIQWICINRRRAGEGGRSGGEQRRRVNLRRLVRIQPAWPVIYEDPQSRLCSKSSVRQPFFMFGPPTSAPPFVPQTEARHIFPSENS